MNRRKFFTTLFGAAAAIVADPLIKPKSTSTVYKRSDMYSKWDEMKSWSLIGDEVHCLQEGAIRTGNTIGTNRQRVMLDEGNFRNEKDADESAYKLYDDARVRLQNRFQRTKGYLLKQ